MAGFLQAMGVSGVARMNRMIHIAAITQIRLETEGRTYYRRKLANGKSRMAVRRP